MSRLEPRISIESREAKIDSKYVSEYLIALYDRPVKEPEAKARTVVSCWMDWEKRNPDNSIRTGVLHISTEYSVLITFDDVNRGRLTIDGKVQLVPYHLQKGKYSIPITYDEKGLTISEN
jgi:hypothetical protein